MHHIMTSQHHRVELFCPLALPFIQRCFVSEDGKDIKLEARGKAAIAPPEVKHMLGGQLDNTSHSPATES